MYSKERHDMSKGNKKSVKNPDPMSNARTMGREGMKIIRNIAFGSYNIYNDGHVFRNLDFVKATISEVDKRLLDASIHVQAIKYAYAGTDNQDVLNLLLRDSKTLEAYTLVRGVLENIVISNGDTGFLYVLANKLPIYKYNI